MQNEKKLKFQMLLLTLAEYLQIAVTERLMSMYADDLLELSEEQLLTAMQCYKNDPTLKAIGKFPLPIQLKNFVITPQLTPRQIATDTTNKVMSWVKGQSYLWTHNVSYTTYCESTKKACGELGFLLIQKLGWRTIEDTPKSDTAFVAQMRDLAEALYIKSLSGGDVEKPHDFKQIEQTIPEMKKLGLDKLFIGDSNVTR